MVLLIFAYVKSDRGFYVKGEKKVPITANDLIVRSPVKKGFNVHLGLNWLFCGLLKFTYQFC